MRSLPSKIIPPVLEPIDRLIEVLCGLVMVLTFTSSLSVAEAGQADVRQMLAAAIGCNLAWGIIDAIVYLMNCLARRGHDLRLWHRLRDSKDAAEIQEILRRRLPAPVAAALEPSEMMGLHRRLLEQPEPPCHPKLTRDEWLGSVGIFLLVTISTFPVVLPFLFVGDPKVALRLSNAIAVISLFFTGFYFAKHSSHRPWKFGLIVVVLGTLLTGVAMALGG